MVLIFPAKRAKRRVQARRVLSQIAPRFAGVLSTNCPPRRGADRASDVGNWSEGLGLASMFVEGAVIVLAGYAWALARHERCPGVHASVARQVTAER